MSKAQQIVYEQCPFVRDHVLELYRILKEVVADGDWHPIPLRDKEQVGHYRVRRGYFQALYGVACALMEEAMRMEPMEIQDDAEWTLEKHGPGEYALRTRFGETFGQVTEQLRLDKLLEPLGLWIDLEDGRLAWGVATFGRLEPEAVLDANHRLGWIEAHCMEANRGVKAMLSSFWKQVTDDAEGQLHAAGQIDFGPKGEIRRRVAKSEMTPEDHAQVRRPVSD